MGEMPPQSLASHEISMDTSLNPDVYANAPRSQSNSEYDGHSQYGATSGTPTLDMRSMANALPDMRQHPQQYSMPSNNSSGMYQYSQGVPFASQMGAAYPAQQFPQNYSQPRHNFQNLAGGSSISSQSYQSPGQHLPHGMVQNISGYPQQYLNPQAQYNQNVRSGQQQFMRPPAGPGAYQNSGAQMINTGSESSMPPSSNVLRGPPRKPKQSGHALWVGNLPPGTNIIDLKDRFSQDATNDIESVFLISKSNCAFVNYKSEESCQGAMTRFHDSRFHGMRLVCRLRRGSSSSVQQQVDNPEGPPYNSEEGSRSALQPQEKMKEKYFVVKSLTMEDLERSVHSGVWATQAHNETALSKAYDTTEDVFLIFSANKSGEYFGYARMASAIGDEEAAAKTEPPVSQLDTSTATTTNTPSPNPADAPLTIPTTPTATAPPGRIIDDSSRGTIFWEATPTTNPDDDSDPPPNPTEDSTIRPTQADTSSTPSSGNATPSQTTFGKPFKIEWLSTNRLPFYRTRGLRNPWNANREVKIARDGTEIEPSVGRRLIAMFHVKWPEPPPPGPQQMYQYQQQQQMGMMGPVGGRGMMVPPQGPAMMGGGYMPQQGGGGGGGMMGPGSNQGYGRGGY